MKYLEFSFSLTPDNQDFYDVLSAELAEIGFESFLQEDNHLLAYIQKESCREAEVKRVADEFPIENVKISYSVKEPEDKDWNEEWEKNFFQPIVIDKRCVIHSTFHKEVPKCEYDIIINPQMAFGTGHHETTSQIIGELLEADMTGKKVLDMGCGTSILAILARMRGAEECLAIDIDDWCVRNSLENIELNHLDSIKVLQGDASTLKDKGPFDIIIANINRNILLNDMKYYIERLNKGGKLFMSGFYVKDIPAIQEEAEKYGLKLEHWREKNNWTAVRFAY